MTNTNSSRSVVTKEYEGIPIQFTGEGWFNATVVADSYKRKPVDWLRLPDTARYVHRLCEIHKVGKSHFIKTKAGKNGGTWLHPDLGVKFAQWLSVDFEIWCNQQIKEIIHGTLDAKRARHQAAASYKLMSDILKLAREQQGKESKSYHYANEARLVNWVITGEFKGLDRDALSYRDLAKLALLEEKNSLLIAAGTPYAVRKTELQRDCNLITHSPAN